MPAPRSHRRARLAVLVSIVLAITGFQFFLAPSRAGALGGTALVISEVYGGRWQRGCSTYNAGLRRAVEPDGSADQRLTGMSVQYR